MIIQAKKIFFLGIKGVAMTNLAVIFKKLGKDVTGSDLSEEFITDSILRNFGITFQLDFDPKKLPNNIDLVVYSAAHQGDRNPQVIEAKKRGIKIRSQAEILGELIKKFNLKVAVCGSHGKTTTSSLLSYALIKLGAKPSYLVGAPMFNSYPGGDFNSRDYFVIEADEYGVNPPYDLTPKFHYLNPDYILCTNIDYDHPDVYPNLEVTRKAFLKFFDKKKLILCLDDKPIVQSINRMESKQIVTYGFNKFADLRILTYQHKQSGSEFHLALNKKSLGTFQIGLFGEKNISNTAGAILTLLQLGFSGKEIKKAIRNFTGAKRRFELINEEKGTYLYDDYAHHPNEIAATINAAKSHFPKHRIVIIFQPHTYSRTQALLNEFARSLSLADKVFVLPIFASARENPKNFKIDSRDIANLNPERITYEKTKRSLLELLSSNLYSQDVIFTMGAGNVYKLKNDIIEIISKK
ncbi:UDP-N-acetylmuramate--L-alanine ligase [Candidatus Roizmanbacteria bacterium RIFCSPHIGHO2_02_FULL_37_15]|nr:MAG: UDP-N-acetylmuramate--L-alanine ligase [Candidatus Roizmanbacteria bacterium RIFCSPHIGHO2_02_FULL_37_15]